MVVNLTDDDDHYTRKRGSGAKMRNREERKRINAKMTKYVKTDHQLLSTKYRLSFSSTYTIADHVTTKIYHIIKNTMTKD